jgi:hypothetical protein
VGRKRLSWGNVLSFSCVWRFICTIHLGISLPMVESKVPQSSHTSAHSLMLVVWGTEECDRAWCHLR